MGGAPNYSGYYQEPGTTTFPTGINQNTMQYQSDYSQDARQPQGFGYNTSMMYNVPQAGGQNTVYDTSQQFQSRQPAALQIMAPDVATPYFGGEPAAQTTAAGLPAQAASSNAPTTVYQQGTERAALLQNYSGGMGAMSGMAQPSSAAEVIDDQHQPQQQVQQPQTSYAVNSVEEAYSEYQSELREVFQNIQNGALANAGELLLRVSKWLLSKVAELGLTLDNKDLHADRIRLWNDFNHAWLALFQRQKDMMESPQRPAGLISQDNLEKMAQELIQLCDGIERHGLVDYQYGVWEEKILQILTDCVDLYEGVDEGASTNAAGSSGHHAVGLHRG